MVFKLLDRASGAVDLEEGGSVELGAPRSEPIAGLEDSCGAVVGSGGASPDCGGGVAAGTGGV